MSKLPQTDSVAELARFGDAHDLTGFDAELEEVQAPVFVRDALNELRVTLPSEEAKALHREAQSRGVEDTDLIREWVREKLRAS